MHARYTLDQLDPFRRSGPQLSGLERMELHDGLRRSQVRDRASPEGEHDLSLSGSHERSSERGRKRVHHV